MFLVNMNKIAKEWREKGDNTCAFSFDHENIIFNT